MNYSKILIDIIRESLNLLEVYDKKNKISSDNYSYKKNEIKTKIDLELQKFIIKKLIIYKFPIISEEKYNKFIFQKGKGPVWILDPLDGTYNFFRGINHCAISLALYEDAKPIIGVIGNYPSKKILIGGPKVPSLRENKKISVSKNSKFNQSILATGFPSSYKFSSSKYNSIYMSYFKKFSKIRMIGSAASSLAMVSEGICDAYYENGIKIWDIAAGLSILIGAGGNYSLRFINNDTVEILAWNNSLKLKK